MGVRVGLVGPETDSSWYKLGYETKQTGLRDEMRQCKFEPIMTFAYLAYR